MSWAYEEEFSIRDGFRWSPDGTQIAYWQFDTSGVRDFVLINNTDSLYPELTYIPYPKVGETVSAALVGVVPADGGRTVWAKLPGDPRQHYVPRMGWANDSDFIVAQQLNRKQDTNRVFYADARTGDVELVFTEEELHYIESVQDPHWLEESGEFLWQSERDGWRHNHRVSRDGETFTDLTPGDFDVEGVARIDESAVGCTSSRRRTRWKSATCTEAAERRAFDGEDHAGGLCRDQRLSGIRRWAVGSAYASDLPPAAAVSVGVPTGPRRAEGPGG